MGTVELVTLIVLLTLIIGVPAVCIIVSNIRDKKRREAEKNKENEIITSYYKNEGLNDVKLLEDFMKENNIALPTRQSDLYVYIRECLKATRDNIREKFDNSIHAAGYGLYIQEDSYFKSFVLTL